MAKSTISMAMASIANCNKLPEANQPVFITGISGIDANFYGDTVKMGWTNMVHDSTSSGEAEKHESNIF